MNQLEPELEFDPLQEAKRSAKPARRLRLVCLPCRESLKLTLRASGDRRARAVLEDRIDQVEQVWTERHEGHEVLI